MEQTNLTGEFELVCLLCFSLWEEEEGKERREGGRRETKGATRDGRRHT
jgi:hypothetical protein